MSNCRRTCCLLGAAVLAGFGASAACAAGDGDSVAGNPEPVSGDVEVLEESRASPEPRRRHAGSLERRAAEARPSADRWALALGVQIRARGDFTRNQSLTDFAFAPSRDEAQFLQRTRVNASVENAGLGVEVFAQGQWYGRWGGVEDRSDPDLYQAYVEWRDALGFPISVKAGRQDFSYGSTFLLGPNDFYNGLSWDGLKASIRPVKDLDVDLIASRMAELNPGDPEIYLAGVYATYAGFEEASVDGYFFHNEGGYPLLHREFEKRDSGQKWFSLGTRLAGKAWGFDGELEPQFQWGRVKTVIGDGKEVVRAYGGHLDLGYTFESPWQPRIFAAYAFGSGHNSIFNGRYEEFHGNIFNDNYLVGDMSVVADLSGVTVDGVHASGMHVGVAGISMNPWNQLNLNFDVHRFIASKVPAGVSRDLGVEVNLVASYKPTQWLSVLVGLNRFYTGNFFTQAAGTKRDIDYAYLQTQVEF